MGFVRKRTCYCEFYDFPPTESPFNKLLWDSLQKFPGFLEQGAPLASLASASLSSRVAAQVAAGHCDIEALVTLHWQSARSI